MKFKFLILPLALIALLVSCRPSDSSDSYDDEGDDEETTEEVDRGSRHRKSRESRESRDMLVGTWSLQDGDTKVEIEFQANHKITLTQTNLKKQRRQIERNFADWEHKGDKIIISRDGQVGELEIVSLDKSSLCVRDNGKVECYKRE